MNTPNKKNYRDILREELEARCHKNPYYSLRAFARDLGMAPARLSDVLRGRYGFSREAAANVAKILGWSEAKTIDFCDLVDADRAGKRLRRLAQKNLAEVSAQQKIALDNFAIVSDWYHYAILELIDVDGFNNDAQWIAQHLNINPEVVEPAIGRLIRAGLLTNKNGKLRPCETFTATPSDVPSEALKKFHHQILEKATQALIAQKIDKRDFSSLTLAFDSRDIVAAKNMIKNFRREFNRQFSSTKRKDSVYNLGIQFFRF